MNTSRMPRAAVLSLLMILALPQAYSVEIPPPPGIPLVEGYGAVTTGGDGGDVYRVTSLADSGPGTLRDGVVNRTGARTIIFEVAGTISLDTNINIRLPYLTIAGETAPSPGMTITRPTLYGGTVIICGTHDIILRHLRFKGLYVAGGLNGEFDKNLTIDGDSGPDRVAQRIVLDHLTCCTATDGGPDIWGEVSDVTVSWCFMYRNWHPTLISHYPAPFQKRRRISMHHNVYAQNNERNPQIRADVAEFDYVNNVVYDWGYFIGWGFGIRIVNHAGEPKVSGNFINNYFLPGDADPAWALVYGSQPGADLADGGPGGTPAQGTLVTTSAMGELYVAGNLLPEKNRDHFSTVAARLPVPAVARVTTWMPDELKSRLVPYVGMKYRTAGEQAILDELSSAMIGTPLSVPGDLDADGDVDADDVARLQTCMTGENKPQTDEHCRQARLDADADVDLCDFSILQRCLTGPDAPADPSCAD